MPAFKHMGLCTAGPGWSLGGPSCHHHAHWHKHPSGLGCPGLTPRPNGPWCPPWPYLHLGHTTQTPGWPSLSPYLPSTLWPHLAISWTCYTRAGPRQVRLPTSRWYWCNLSIQSHQLKSSPVHCKSPTKTTHPGSFSNELWCRQSPVPDYGALCGCGITPSLWMSRTKP